MNTGKELKDILKESKGISSGITFKAGSVRLGKTVFDVHMENKQEKRNEMITKKKKNEEKEYNDNVAKAKAAFEKKNNLENMTIKELTIICKPLKRKEEGNISTKKVELINKKYKEWNGRPAPTFDVLEYGVIATSNNDNDNSTPNNNADDYFVKI